MSAMHPTAFEKQLQKKEAKNSYYKKRRAKENEKVHPCNLLTQIFHFADIRRSTRCSYSEMWFWRSNWKKYEKRKIFPTEFSLLSLVSAKQLPKRSTVK